MLQPRSAAAVISLSFPNKVSVLIKTGDQEGSAVVLAGQQPVTKAQPLPER